jgi:Uma2 family endonuclease
MAESTRSRLTLEEFLSYDDSSGIRYELVDGVLVEKGAESTINTLIAGFLLLQFAGMGIPSYRVGFKQWLEIENSAATARDPDLIVHSEASFTAIEGAVQALIPATVQAPMLVVEVVSPGDLKSDNYKRDYIDKRQEYALRGIPEYWIVDPDRAIVVVLTLNEKTYQSREFKNGDRIFSTVFPDCKLTADQVLRGGRE